MSDRPLLVELQAVSLKEKGRALSLQLHAGDLYAVMGPASSGKTSLIDLVTGDLKPPRGKVVGRPKVVAPSDGTYSRRATPTSVAKANTRTNSPGHLVAVLSALHLWDVREATVSRLTPGRALAVDLLPVFLQSADLALIDGHFDYMDPWMLDDTLDLVEQQAQEGKAFLVVTSRPDIADRLGNIIVFKDSVPRFAGTCRELIEHTSPAEVHVEAEDESTVRTMVEPFTVSIKSAKGSLLLTAHNGQELAARLLTHGYGNVKSVILKEPTLEEAIQSLY